MCLPCCCKRTKKKAQNALTPNPGRNPIALTLNTLYETSRASISSSTNHRLTKRLIKDSNSNPNTGRGSGGSCAEDVGVRTVQAFETM